MDFLGAITPGHVALFLVGLGYCYKGIKWVTTKTETKKDDAVIAKIDTGLAWVFQASPYFWHIVEAAGKFGGLPGGVSKATHFLQEVHAAYAAQHGQALPPAAEDLAQTIAKGLSAADKLGKSASPALK